MTPSKVKTWPRGISIGIKILMTLDEFSTLSTALKWTHIKQVMTYIEHMEETYDKHRRLNRTFSFLSSRFEVDKIRADQHQRWSHIKDLYAANRDELANTLDSEDFQECKNILERVFTTETDNVLQDLIGDNSDPI